jgi:Flp pilus assembly protein TadD
MSLRAVFDHLSSSDTPKTILFISEGLIVDRDFKELAWIGPRAAAAHVTLYVLQLDSTDSDAGSRRGTATRSEDHEVLREGLDVMAGLARGDVFRVVANPDFAFERVALEMSGYYLLSFEPLPGDRDGNPHRIRIESSRRGVEVRARREFSAGSPVAKTTSDLLADTLRSPLLVSDIPLTLTTYTFQDPDSSRLKVFLAAEIDRSQNIDTPMALGYVMSDEKGKAVASRVEASLASPARMDTKTQSYVGAAVVPPGLYTLKLAVVDETGKRGSVERTFTARINAFGPVHVTDLLIADNSAPAGGPGLAPTTTARFTGDQLHGYLELFSDAPGQLQDVTIAIEVAQAEDGRALDSVPATFQNVSSGGERRRAAEASVPIGLLPPGEYVARAVVSVADRKVGQVSRPFTVKRAATSFATLGSAAARPRPAAAAAPFTVRIDPFDLPSVFAAPILGFFLDRLAAASGGAVSTIRPALEAARAGRFDEVLTATAPGTGEQPATLFLNGLALLSRKDVGAAAERFRTALAGDSALMPATFYLGACYAAVGRDREAAAAWQLLLAGEARAPFIAALLGDALLRQREMDRAIEVLTSARALWPGDDEITTRLGTALAMNGNGSDALKVLEPYLASHPADHERLFIALRALYDARVAGRAIAAPDEDRARFMQYADAYTRANGPQRALVDQWKQFVAKQ